MRRWILRVLAMALLAMATAGCATYPDGYYRSYDGAYGDGYATYGDDYRYLADDPEDEAYWRDTWWPYYTTVLYPVYSVYYDPWYAPGFYYGVTWYPHYHGLGWYGDFGWPYRYVAYSPYVYSWWDNYYAWDWYWYDHHHHHDHDRGHGRDRYDNYGGTDWRRPYPNDGRPRYGSIDNANERLAHRPGRSGTWRESPGRAGGVRGGDDPDRDWRRERDAEDPSTGAGAPVTADRDERPTWRPATPSPARDEERWSRDRDAGASPRAPSSGTSSPRPSREYRAPVIYAPRSAPSSSRESSSWSRGSDSRGSSAPSRPSYSPPSSPSSGSSSSSSRGGGGSSSSSSRGSSSSSSSSSRDRDQPDR